MPEKYLWPLFATFLVVLGQNSFGQAMLNVTNFGAQGDATQMFVKTVSNSSVVTIQSTNQLSNADVGKLILLFGAGPATTPTNHQDLVASITQVSGGTNVTLSLPTGATSNNVLATYGTQNATAFQNCINAASGTNTIVSIPAGTYLLISPAAISPSFVMQNYSDQYPAVTVQKGGLHFLGAGMTNTILMGCGAWQNKGSWGYRGYMFALQGPVTNDAPLIFDSLTMDGGVPAGNTSFHGSPISTNDGSGWDNTHHAVVDVGPPPLQAHKAFQNCAFRHWRGEMFTSFISQWDGFILVTNCVFSDGNATAYNFNFTHNIVGCTFSNMFQVSEFYQAYCSNACYFQNNLATNMTGNCCIAINGAVTNRAIAPYNIQSNTFYSGGFMILTSPANNLYITGNRFFGSNCTGGIGLGCAGYQGTAINSNIFVQDNIFSNSYYVLEVLGVDQDMSADVYITSNTAVGVHNFAGGYGASTNVWLVGNVADATTGPVNNAQMQGQWVYDDLSEQIPYNFGAGAPGATNIISYCYGARQSTWSQHAGTSYYLDDAHPSQMPSGAMMVVSNYANSTIEQLYTSSTRPASPLTLGIGAALMFQWTNGAWQQYSTLPPPTNFHVVSP